MTPKKLVKQWVELFNQGNADEIALLYHEDAINHQVPNEAIVGKMAIKEMFKKEFSKFEMTCITENLFEDGEWAILEWKDPNGLRGCGFFHIIENKIKLQQGYWDKLTLLKKHNLPISE